MLNDGISNQSFQNSDKTELGSKTKKGDSCIVTLESHEKAPFKRNRFKSNPLLIHFDSLFGLGN